jgi:P4 family phage/plasmid primase-like protien
MNSRPFSDHAPAYWDAGFSPIPIVGKQPAVKNWTSYCDNLPKPETRAEWLTKFPGAGIGLALGKELVGGYRLGAIDVDDDRFVAAVGALIGVPCPIKIGKKGKTFFVLIERSKTLKSTALRTASGKHAIDLLISGKQTVVPPSIHPETEQPYRWQGTPLLDFHLDNIPRLTWRQIEMLAATVASSEAEVLATGTSTHEAGLKLAAKLVRFEEDDERLISFIAALFPIGYAGDSLKELPGWISSAREKGFAVLAALPVDEAAARVVADQLKPLAFSPRDGYLRYQEGHWAPVSQSEIKRHLKAHLLTVAKPGSTVANLLRSAELCLALNIEDQGFGKPNGLICMQNGALDVRNGVLLPHSPEHRLLFALNVEWDPNAECPIYERQLEDTLRGDHQAMAVFEEFAGLTLIPDQRFQKALFLMGEGGSGKSTLLRTIQMMHDPNAVSVTPLDKIEDERYRTDVVGKLVCISFDVQTRHRIFGETFVRITGGDPVAVRQLYKEVEGMVQPSVRFIGSMNPDMPPYQGAPDALRRRLLLLTCGARIQNPDPDREKHLSAEKAGILARWVMALQRLYQRGGFDIPKASKLEVDDYLVAYEPFDSFAAEWLEKSIADVIPIAEVTIKFSEWADAQQDKPLSTHVVGRKLKRLGFRLEQKRITRGGKSVNTRVVFARWTRSHLGGGGGGF